MEGSMMKKTFRMEDLECANCAAKMEKQIAKLPGVNSVSISFMTQKMILDADDARFQDILKEAAVICRKVEPDCRILV